MHRDGEGEPIIGRIGEIAAGVEIATGGAADIAARRKPAAETGFENAGADGPVLERGGVVVEGDEPREIAVDRVEEGEEIADALRRQVDRDAAGDDAVHHQAMAEGAGGEAENPLAEDRAMGVHQAEGGIVADGADVAEMIGEALEFGHDRAEVGRARRRLQRQRRFDGAGKGIGIGDGRIAGDAAGEPRRPVEIGALHQALDALVDVAEPFLQPDHGLAARGEAEMAGLDDAGVDRADGDLVQAVAFGGEEAVGRGPEGVSIATPPRRFAPTPIVGGSSRGG